MGDLPIRVQRIQTVTTRFCHIERLHVSRLYIP
jgi:hypothetical protein